MLYAEGETMKLVKSDYPPPCPRCKVSMMLEQEKRRVDVGDPYGELMVLCELWRCPKCFNVYVEEEE